MTTRTQTLSPASPADALIGAAPGAPASPRPPPIPRSPHGLLWRAWHFVGSYPLAIILLLVLMVIVFYGTLAQGSMSLYDVQRDVFTSWGTILTVGGVPIPFPGGFLALALLAGNLVVGGIIRIRKRGSTVGVIIAHAGILLLFGGSLVEYFTSDKGQLTVYEGEGKEEFQSYDEWEVAVAERIGGSRVREYVLPSTTLDGLRPADVARFGHRDLPFQVAVSGWQRNSDVEFARPLTTETEQVDGVRLVPLAPVGAGEKVNLPGCFVTVSPKGAPAVRSILCAAAASRPFVADVAGRRFEVELRQRRWALPFRVTLTKFIHREHPGTRMPSEFSSKVTKLEDGVERDVHITMNEPLRHRGYTLYQSGWGPQHAKPGTRLFSTFSVVRNPSDKVPEYACYVIGLGLGIHFLVKLIRYIDREATRRASVKEVAS